VLLWPVVLQVQRTVSPGWIVTEEGVKTGPPLPTVTVTVAALATVGLKTRTATITPTNTAKQREDVFIASIIYQFSLPASNTGKVTPLLPLQTVKAAAPFVWSIACS